MDKKTISISPELFSMSGRKKKANKKTKKVKPKPLIKPNVLQKELLKKIKSHSQNRERNGDEKKKSAEENVAVSNNEFEKHFEYLNDLRKNKKKNKQQKKSRRNKPIANASNVISPSPAINHSFIPDIRPPMTPPPPLAPIAPVAPIAPIIVPEESNLMPVLNPPVQNQYLPEKEPPYSNLKNGNKPSYRTWKSKTQKNIEPIKNIVISTPEPVINDVENMQISNDVNPPKIAAQDNEKIKKKAHVKRTKKKYKYKLGKNDDTSKVGVFIKSNYNRGVIQDEIKKIQQTPINEIKDYLRKQSLIKIGSLAPNDVLRKMYEDCMLSGEIMNHSGENLVHNYLNE